MDVMTLILFVVGLLLLIAGAEALVRGASRLADAVGISPLVIGLTVVAYGTSAPELAVNVQSALAGQADLAVGNVVGSNIFTILFILGLSALISPLIVSYQLVRLDVPIMIGVSVLLLLLALDGRLGRLEGTILFGGMLAYTGFVIWLSRKEQAGIQDQSAARGGRHLLLQVGLLLAGLGLLVVGARWLVNGAVAVATALGISELVIGLTIVAVGTSLPEVATSIMAALRGERDIAVGNVVGSNIFNILMVLGLTSLIVPDGVIVAAGVISFDLPVMIAVALACLPIFLTGHLIARWEGGLFLAYYVAYALYLFLAATEHDALPAYSIIMLAFVLPITLVTVAIIVGRTLRSQWSRSHSGTES